MKKEFDIWTDLQLNAAEDGVVVDVWNRQYTFKKSFLPTSIKIADKEILKRPATLDAYFGDKKGEWTKFAYFVYEKDEEDAVVLISATCENIILNAAVTFSFDGFIKLDFKVVPFWSFSKELSVPKLTGLCMDFAIKNEYSNLFHFWPNTETNIITLSDVNSGKTVNKDYPFKPYLWIGNEDGGLGISCESDEKIQLNDKKKYAQVEVFDDYTNLHIHILDSMPIEWQSRKDEWLDALSPVCYCFGLQATPVKKMPENMREHNRKYHIYRMKTDAGYCSEENYNTAKKAAQAGVKYLILHADWSVFENHGRAENDGKLKEFIEYCHNMGMKVLLYFGFEYSTLLPDWSENANEYLTKNIHGHIVGGWQRNYEFMHRNHIVCYKSGYSKTMIEQVEFAMDNYNADGIYTDGTHVPWECANEVHGCGYTDNEGKRHITYPILAVREHVRKLYAAVHKRNGIIDTHQSTCCLMATLSFADSYFDGENIQGELRNKGIEYLDLEAFRTEYIGKNLGLAPTFIAYTDNVLTVDLLVSLALIHNVFPGVRRDEDLELMKKLWKIWDEHSLDNATFYPYWNENNKFKIIDDEKSKLSYYDNGDEIVIVVASFDKENSTLKIKVPENVKVEELYSKNAEVAVTDDILSIKMRYCEFGIFSIKK